MSKIGQVTLLVAMLVTMGYSARLVAMKDPAMPKGPEYSGHLRDGRMPRIGITALKVLLTQLEELDEKSVPEKLPAIENNKTVTHHVPSGSGEPEPNFLIND